MRSVSSLKFMVSNTPGAVSCVHRATLHEIVCSSRVALSTGCACYDLCWVYMVSCHIVCCAGLACCCCCPQQPRGDFVLDVDSLQALVHLLSSLHHVVDELALAILGISTNHAQDAYRHTPTLDRFDSTCVGGRVSLVLVSRALSTPEVQLVFHHVWFQASCKAARLCLQEATLSPRGRFLHTELHVHCLGGEGLNK